MWHLVSRPLFDLLLDFIPNTVDVDMGCYAYRNKPIIVELISLIVGGLSEEAAISQLQVKLDELRPPAAGPRSPVEDCSSVRALSDFLGDPKTGTGFIQLQPASVCTLIRDFVDSVCR